MSDTPKQPPFQLHLSTLLIAALIAGGMIYADLRYYREISRDPEGQHRRNWQRYAQNETLRLALFQGGCLILFVVGCELLIRRGCEGRRP